MPVLDMPREKLESYLGCTPEPVDFDDFWDGELKKIHDFDGEYFFTPYKTVAVGGYVIETLYFAAPDGSRICARVTRPDRAEKMPVLFRFHGKSGKMSSVNSDLGYAAAGFAVISMDCRSQSGGSDDRTDRGLMTQSGLLVRGLSKGRDYLYYKDVFLDVVRLTDIIKKAPFCDAEKMFAYGGSQGGGLSVVCAALCPEIKAACCFMPYLSDYKRLYEMDLMKGAYGELNDYIRNFCPEEGAARDEMWTTLGYVDVQNFARRVKADVMWFTGLMDSTCPPSTQYACYNKLRCNKQAVVYTNHGHEVGRSVEESALMYLLAHV